MTDDLEPLARLGLWVLQISSGFLEIETCDIQDQAKKLGVIVPVDGGFDPKIHDDYWDCAEPGDNWLEYSPTTKKFMEQIKGQ